MNKQQNKIFKNIIKLILIFLVVVLSIQVYYLYEYQKEYPQKEYVYNPYAPESPILTGINITISNQTQYDVFVDLTRNSNNEFEVITGMPHDLVMKMDMYKKINRNMIIGIFLIYLFMFFEYRSKENPDGTPKQHIEYLCEDFKKLMRKK